MFRQTGDAMGCQTVDATDEWKWSRKDLRREHDMVSAHCTVHRHRKAHLTGENHRRHFNIRGVDLDCSRRVQKLRCSLLVPVTEAMFEPVLHQCYQECRTLTACACNIWQGLQYLSVGQLKDLRVLSHPDKFSKCRADRVELFKKQASEVFVVVEAMYRERK
jgi:hypothetical protein